MEFRWYIRMRRNRTLGFLGGWALFSIMITNFFLHHIIYQLLNSIDWSATCWQHVGDISAWQTHVCGHHANMRLTCQQVTCRPPCRQLFVSCCQHVGQHVGNMLPQQTHVRRFDPHFDMLTSNFASKGREKINRRSGHNISRHHGLHIWESAVI